MASADLTEIETDAELPAARPFLRRVRIRGYKSIAFCDVTLEPLTVLVGRNGCGKSNFLDALAFLRDAVKYDVREAVQRHGGWSAVACRTTNAPIEFQIVTPISCDTEATNGTVQHGDLVDLVYSLRIVGGNDVAPRVDIETLGFTNPNGDVESLFERDTSSSTLGFSFLPTSGMLETVLGKGGGTTSAKLAVQPENCSIRFLNHEPYSKLTDAIRKSAFLNPNPDAIRNQQIPSSGMFLDKNAATLPSVIRQFAQSSRSWFERASRYVRYIVPEVADFRHIRYGESETIRFWMNSKVNNDSLEFDARSMSDGTLRAIACIIGAFQDIPPMGRPSLVGIEEPETSLHPGAMNGLVDALDEASLATQIIITTHSAELLDNPTIKPKNVRVVQMEDGKTIIGPVDAASFEIVQDNLSSLGGLERDNLLEVDLDDLDRQQKLANAETGSE